MFPQLSSIKQYVKLVYALCTIHNQFPDNDLPVDKIGN